MHTQTYTAEHDGAVVFVETPADVANQSGQTINVACRGYYYFDSEVQGGTWIPFRPCTSLPSNNKPCIVKISATETKEFMCHNMGADQSLDPHDMSQPNAWALNGSYIQWGKKHDMYDTQNNGADGFAAAPTGATDAESNKRFISGWSCYAQDPGDAWLNPANQPCPSGYRLPTKDEWDGVLANNSVSTTTTNWNDSPTNYGSALHFKNASGDKILTLPAAGIRQNGDGTLGYRGSVGHYWSGTKHSNNLNAYCLYFNSSNQNRTLSYCKIGLSVRCLKD